MGVEREGREQSLSGREEKYAKRARVRLRDREKACNQIEGWVGDWEWEAVVCYGAVVLAAKTFCHAGCVLNTIADFETWPPVGTNHS